MQPETLPAAIGPILGEPPREIIKKKGGRTDKFFSVCSDVIDGFRPSDPLSDLLALVVLASGTAKDHASTSWSAQAVAKALGIRKQSAADAIERLRRAGRLISLVPEGKRPSARSWNYKLTVSPDRTRRVWLPNTLVDGATEETPPLRLLMQGGDIKPALLLLRCYRHLDMLGCGGVDHDLIRSTWKPLRAIERHDGWTLYATSEENRMIAGDGLFDGSYRRRDEARWDGLLGLFHIGLLTWVDHARTDGPDGVNLGPIVGETGSDGERGIGSAQADRAFQFATDLRCGIAGGERLLMIRSRIANPIAVSVARPRYLPRTYPVVQWHEDIEARVGDRGSPIAL